jgi:hypothetical protein
MKENKIIEKKNLPWINGVLPQSRSCYSRSLQVEVPEQGAHVLVHGFLAVTDLIQGLGGVFIPLALVFTPLVLLSLVFLYGLEGVVSALMECHILFMYLWDVVESSLRSTSKLEILVVMTMMGTRG